MSRKTTQGLYQMNYTQSHPSGQGPHIPLIAWWEKRVQKDQPETASPQDKASQSEKPPCWSQLLHAHHSPRSHLIPNRSQQQQNSLLISKCHFPLKETRVFLRNGWLRPRTGNVH